MHAPPSPHTHTTHTLAHTHMHTHTCTHTHTHTQKAAVISDIIVLYVLGKRTYYRKKKYLNVNDPIADDYQIIDDEDRDEVR